MHEKREKKKERYIDISNLNDQMLLMHANTNAENMCVETHFVTFNVNMHEKGFKSMNEHDIIIAKEEEGEGGGERLYLDSEM